jgi:hypothetical protein
LTAEDVDGDSEEQEEPQHPQSSKHRPGKVQQGVVVCRHRHGGGHVRVPFAGFDTSRQPGGRAGLRLWCECVVQPSSARDDVHGWGVRRIALVDQSWTARSSSGGR